MLPKEPLVSVIIPAYNAEQFIAESIQSAVSQTYPSKEIIVVDDGSTDGTRAVLRKFEGLIRRVDQPNRGPASARNHGIRVSRGLLIAFLDADDLWLPKKLEHQVNWICSHPEFGIVTTDVMDFDEHGQRNPTLHNRYPIENGFVVERLLFHNWIGASAAMVRRECFDRIGGFEERLTSEGRGQCTAEDWLMWMQIASRYRVHFIDEVLVQHRIHRSNSSEANRDLLFEHLLQNVEVMGRTIPQLQSKPRLLRRAAARICRIRAMDALMAGQFTGAREKFWKALTIEPWNARLWLLAAGAYMPAAALSVMLDQCRRLRRIARKLRSGQPSDRWRSAEAQVLK